MAVCTDDGGAVVVLRWWEDWWEDKGLTMIDPFVWYDGGPCCWWLVWYAWWGWWYGRGCIPWPSSLILVINSCQVSDNERTKGLKRNVFRQNFKSCLPLHVSLVSVSCLLCCKNLGGRREEWESMQSFPHVPRQRRLCRLPFTCIPCLNRQTVRKKILSENSSVVPLLFCRLFVTNQNHAAITLE